MRTMNINKQTIYYANPTGTETVRYDSYGNETGSPLIVYGNPQSLKVNVSSGSGSSNFEPYGVSPTATRRIVSCELLPLTLESHLWIGIAATSTVDGVTTVLPHNFIVSGIEPSVNSISYNLKEVSVS